MTGLISEIPEEELRKDLEESYKDLLAAKAALKLGITTCGTGSVQSRIDSNKHFIEVITTELSRRGKSSVTVLGGIAS